MKVTRSLRRSSRISGGRRIKIVDFVPVGQVSSEKLMNLAIVYTGKGVNLAMGNYSNSEIIFIVEESPEGGYEARSLNYLSSQKRIPMKS